jgi:hypothetical protein
MKSSQVYQKRMMSIAFNLDHTFKYKGFREICLLYILFFHIFSSFCGFYFGDRSDVEKIAEAVGKLKLIEDG